MTTYRMLALTIVLSAIAVAGAGCASNNADDVKPPTGMVTATTPLTIDQINAARAKRGSIPSPALPQAQ